MKNRNTILIASTIPFLFLVSLLFVSASGCDAEGERTSDDPNTDTDSDDDPNPPDACKADEFNGEGTYYGANGSGNCSFPASPDDLDVAAMNHQDYSDSEVCGSCVEIDGPEGSIRVRIVDQCPECKPGDIDLSESAFASMAEPAAGRVPIKWRYVPCAVTGPIVYHFKEGSNQWWSAVQIRNHRHQIESLEYLDGSGNYKKMDRANYNFFLEEAGMGPGPYGFRVTDIYGNMLEDVGIELVEAGEVEGSGQFPDCT